MSLQNLNSPLLRGTLYANAVFSGVSGLVFLLLPEQLSGWLFASAFDLLGLGPALLIRLSGVMLLGFALLVFLAARRSGIAIRHVQLICLTDLGWVIGSAACLIWGASLFTTAGFWAELLVAALVLDFALLQAWALRRGLTARQLSAAA